MQEVVFGDEFELILDKEIDKKGGSSKTHNNAKKRRTRKQKTLILLMLGEKCKSKAIFSNCPKMKSAFF